MLHSMDGKEKTRENRLRRMAARQRMQLQRAPRRDPNAWDYGTYQLVSIDTNAVVAQDFTIGHGYGLSLDDIEERLTREKEDHR
jgi:hypothetical protein